MRTARAQSTLRPEFRNQTTGWWSPARGGKPERAHRYLPGHWDDCGPACIWLCRGAGTAAFVVQQTLERYSWRPASGRSREASYRARARAPHSSVTYISVSGTKVSVCFALPVPSNHVHTTPLRLIASIAMVGPPDLKRTRSPTTKFMRSPLRVSSYFGPSELDDPHRLASARSHCSDDGSGL